MSLRQVDAAVAAAAAAQPAWFDAGLGKRHEMLAAAIDRLSARSEAEGLAELITREMGKVIGEARAEVDAVVSKDEFLTLVRGANEDQVIDPASGTTIVRAPHGVVAVISPWNFPADEILLLALPALMAGNTVVVKPSEVTPLVGAFVVSSLKEALPAGVISLLQGDGEVGKQLVTHKQVDMIGFTGSCPTGRSIMAAAGQGLSDISM